MKTTIAIVLLSINFSFAQEISGIYLSANDFKSDKLSFPENPNQKSHRIKLHNSIYKPFIEIKKDSENIVYRKSDVFGYKTVDGNAFRFVKESEYKILESKAITLYARTYFASKATVKTEYFFSIDTSSAILPLTVFNLKNAFPINHQFHDLLNIYFDNDDNKLIKYDAFNKTYLLNHLLEESLNKKQ